MAFGNLKPRKGGSWSVHLFFQRSQVNDISHQEGVSSSSSILPSYFFVFVNHFSNFRAFHQFSAYSAL
ncbi:MAG: hypothetical protein A3H01_01460 [Candidatus Wildermuthbacteria bacterium RIFCSPLOWO2_12_FULL_40_9]|uniref:Uncharacterized protein n=2 Tax=Candidatus Wildermuthiibacteriota TaxID=1817923 RepID=A0A1G2REW0_9BACT|nr:MAG: hypothetical protein A3F15_00055 [Candidatus Wildermuthbacteria bacterium RIFCSPHIGHO2_12_FULL_40_12]OHA76996.1 MAG: hypothetical protein A3H01_01460 [Candidatus Wildermuthbacteria bacterium RIFCSPLOWO2_12_FULL_40_9]